MLVPKVSLLGPHRGCAGLALLVRHCNIWHCCLLVLPGVVPQWSLLHYFLAKERWGILEERISVGSDSGWGKMELSPSFRIFKSSF